MALLLLMAATAAAQVPLDDNARYLNSFSGLVLGEGRDGLVVGFRGFGLTSRKPRGGFTSGADIDLHGDPDGQIKLATRWLAGIGYLPTPQIRVAAVTGLGVAVGASFTGRSVYATSPDADGGAQAPGAFDTGYYGPSEPGGPDSIVDLNAIVPLMVEGGYVVTPTFAVSARLGVNVSVWRGSLYDGTEGTPNAGTFPEAVVGISLGRRQVARVRGFKVEAGRVHEAWTVAFGWGG